MHLDPESRAAIQRLPFPERRKWTLTWSQIESLPTTKFEPFVPDWQTINAHEDVSPAAADGIARDAERIQALPEVPDER